MSEKMKGTLSRREFAGALAVMAAAPVMLGASPLAAQRKKEEELKPEAKPAEPTAEERRERALKTIRDFKLADGAEPAFAFRADWNHG